MKTSRGISSSWLISHMRGMLLPVMLVYYASSFVAYKVTDTLHLKSKYSLSDWIQYIKYCMSCVFMYGITCFWDFDKTLDNKL